MDHTMFAPRIEALEDRYRIIAYNHRARADRSVSRRVERSGRGRLRRAGASGRRSQTEGLRVQNRNGSLRSEFVLVQQTAESVAPAATPLQVGRRDGARLEERRVLVE